MILKWKWKRIKMKKSKTNILEKIAITFLIGGGFLLSVIKLLEGDNRLILVYIALSLMILLFGLKNE